MGNTGDYSSHHCKEVCCQKPPRFNGGRGDALAFSPTQRTFVKAHAVGQLGVESPKKGGVKVDLDSVPG